MLFIPLRRMGGAGLAAGVVTSSTYLVSEADVEAVTTSAYVLLGLPQGDTYNNHNTYLNATNSSELYITIKNELGQCFYYYRKHGTTYLLFKWMKY